MIEAFTKAWFDNLPAIREKFSSKHPDDYIDIIRAVVQVLSGVEDEDRDQMDPERIHEIDDGESEGVLVYVIGGQGSQPMHTGT